MAISPPYLTRVAVLPERHAPSSFPFNTLTFLSPDFCLSLDRPITFRVGDNGAGKSTLLEAIAWHAGFHETGGSQAHQLHDADGASGEADWARALRLSWKIKPNAGFFFRADRFDQVSRYLDREGTLRGTATAASPPEAMARR